MSHFPSKIDILYCTTSTRWLAYGDHSYAFASPQVTSSFPFLLRGNGPPSFAAVAKLRRRGLELIKLEAPSQDNEDIGTTFWLRGNVEKKCLCSSTALAFRQRGGGGGGWRSGRGNDADRNVKILNTAGHAVGRFTGLPGQPL